jgi:hypothetical protein
MDTPKGGQLCPTWMEVVIHRKDRGHPIVVREYLDEVYRPPFERRDGGSSKGPWQTHTKRFLRHKTLIQGARLAYGFAGIYDEDEAERIVERDITPETTQASGAARLKAAVITHQPAAIIPQDTQGAANAEAAQQPGTVHENGMDEAFTYAEVRTALEKAKNQAAFDMARDTIRGVADEDQRKELNGIADALVPKFDRE